MNCIIIDDEPLAREEMKLLISDYSNLEIIGSFSNAVQALDFLEENEVNIVFLDIEMPKVTGLALASELSKNTMVIFTTAHSHYSLKSYELEAVDYLLKPIDKDRLLRAIDKATAYLNLLSQNVINTIESNTEEFLFIKSDRRFYKINFADILFIEGLKGYVIIHTQTQKLVTAMNLKSIHQRIPSKVFYRVSKSYVVNKNHINSFDSHNIYILDNEIPLGMVYKNDFFEKYSDGTLNLEI